MDILGFLDGLFGSLSAFRSGKKLDEERTPNGKSEAVNANAPNHQTIKSNKDQIKKARSQQPKSKDNDKEMR